MGKETGLKSLVVYERTLELIKNRLEKLSQLATELVPHKDSLSHVQLKILKNYAREASAKRDEFETSLSNVLSTASKEDFSKGTFSDDQNEIQCLYYAIADTLESLTPTEEPPSPTPPHAGSGSHNGTSDFHASVRLPKLELKQFAGEPHSWVSFINLFDTTVHENASLSNISKLQYLLSCLSGEPLSLVKSLTITAANYTVAYDLLKERYHSPRRLLTLHLSNVLDLPSISSSSPPQMRDFINLYYENSQALKALDCDITDQNPLLSALLLRKMDNSLRKRLEGFRSRSTSDDTRSARELPQVQEIIKFLNEECLHIEEASLHASFTPNKPTKAHPPATTSHKWNAPAKRPHVSQAVSYLSTTLDDTTYQNKPPLESCFVCKKTNHKVYQCDTFKAMDPTQRFKIAKDHKRCVSCLGKHDIKDCRSKTNCFTCQKRHHTLLHFSKPLPQSTPSTNSAPVQANDNLVTLTSNTNGFISTSTSTVLLGTALVKVSTQNGTTHVLRALLDSGSMCDFLSERATQLLNAPRVRADHSIVGISQTKTHTKGLTSLTIQTLGGKTIAVNHPFLIMDKISVDLPRATLTPELLCRVKPYILADPTFHLPGGIDILLGGALFPHILTNNTISLGVGMPSVMGTYFGFVVIGQAPIQLSSPPSFSATLLSTTEVDLHSSLQKFWHQEEPPTASTKTKEEVLCDEHFLSTHSRDATGRYCVRLPFKPSHPPLGQSRISAEQRLLSIERKFVRQPEFRKLYVDFMKDYKEAAHMELSSDLPASADHYHLPHHSVLKQAGNTTKLRTVFDASCKTNSGVSLNDTLLTRKKLQNNICDILMMFRLPNIVFSCDIRQMYRQIKVHPDDQRFQLVLWREDLTQPIQTYKLTIVIYGVNCSPYHAIKTLHQLADDEGASYPQAAEVLRSQTYADDVIAGAETEEDALELKSQLVTLLSKGGFELRKWSSNSPRLLENLPNDHLETPVFLQTSPQPHILLLGLHWSPTEDTFTYNINLPRTANTKRQILSIIAQIYDPCGFLSPLIMWAKCFMPITPLSSDPSDFSALTPGHFLIGAPLAAVPEDNLLDITHNRLKHWQLVQGLHQRIWQRWQKEYLHTLQQRAKWNSSEVNLKPGDLVLVNQPTPPLAWPLARVTRVSPGSDGVVRVVHLQTQNGHITRAAAKVFPLPINC